MNQREFYAERSPSPDLSLRYAGWEDCEAGHRFGGVRDHFLFHYVMEGEGSVRVEGVTTRLHAGGGFIFFPGQRHEYRASREKPWRYAWVGFEGPGATSILAAAGLTPGSSVFSRPYSDALGSAMKRVARALEGGGAAHSAARLAAEGWLLLTLSSLASVLEGGYSGPRPRQPTSGVSYAGAARRFMEDHFDRPIIIADVARHVGIDREYLATLFKAEYGITLKACLDALRLLRAKELLSRTTLSVAQIAASVGYREYPVFYRAFQRGTGISPGEWRGKKANQEK